MPIRSIEFRERVFGQVVAQKVHTVGERLEGFEIPVNERFEIQRRAVYLFDQFVCELDLQLARSD